MNLNETALKAIYLMSKSLNNQSLACDLFHDPELLPYCVSQGIEGIVSYCAEKSYNEELIDNKEYTKWEKYRNFHIFRNLRYSLERKAIFEKLTEKQIFFMPLKGILVYNLYPNPGMRSYGDNDVFFDVSKVSEMKTIMESNGYARVEEGNSYHYIYHKEPFLTFEMHIALMKSGMEVSRKRAKAINNYYMNIKDRLIPDKNNSFSLSFSPEDIYIYHLTHAASHFNTSGIGLRFLADAYILLTKYNKTYNWEYIFNILESFEMKGFEKLLRVLSLSLFSPNDYSFEDYQNNLYSCLTENELMALCYISSNSSSHNHDEAMRIQLSLLNQGKSSFEQLTVIDNDFSIFIKLKYVLLYFAQIVDEILINLKTTKKSTVLLLPVLIKKILFKFSHHGETIKHMVKKEK